MIWRENKYQGYVSTVKYRDLWNMRLTYFKVKWTFRSLQRNDNLYDSYPLYDFDASVSILLYIMSFKWINKLREICYIYESLIAKIN